MTPCAIVCHASPQNLQNMEVQCAYGPTRMTTLLSQPKLNCKCSDVEFFDVNRPCVLQVDANDTGLGRALLRDGQPVAFTSPTLSATEVDHATIEKECVAIKVACTKFYQYHYGKQDLIHSDHQPLEMI